MTASPQPLHRLVVSLCLAILLTIQGQAAPFFWDAEPGTLLNQNGNGTWISGGNAADSNWTGSAGGSNTPWTNGSHTANLGATTGYDNDGVGGSITLGENITTNRIDKSSRAGAYIIDPGTGFSLTLTGSNPGFGNNNSSAAAALTINASVDAGTSELLKFNNGTVILAADNTWSGGTRITTNATSGTNSVLQIGNGGTTGTLGSGNVTFATSHASPVSAQTVLALNRSDTVTLTQNLVSGTTDPNKGILRQAGTGTLIVASENTAFTGAAQVTAGTLQIGDGATSGALATATGISISSGATLRFDRTDATSFSTPVTGAGRLQKAGTGTLTLSGAAHTYSGGTVIEAGVLQIANDNALPTSTTVTFSGPGTLDLNGFEQTVGNLSVADNVTGTVIGTGSTLTAGAANMVIGGVAGGSSASLDMSGLDTFVFNGPTRSLSVGGTYVSSAGAALFTSGTLRLAQSNLITAASVNIGNVNSGGGNHENTGTLLLGQTNSITAATLNIGAEFKNQGFVYFADGITGGTVTLRGTNPDERMNILISRHDSNGVTVDESYFDSRGGTLDALVGTLTLGVTSNRSRSALGRFSIGLGTLDATTIILGQRLSSAGSTGGAGASPTGTLELDGGLILARTILFADKRDAGVPGTVTGIFNFLSGTLRAETLQGGAGTEGVSRLLNWTSGTIQPYDASGDLTINDITFQLMGTGDRLFQIGEDRTITLNAAINNGPTAPAVAFTKQGAGTLLVGSSGSTHTGSIDLQEGILRTTTNEVLSNGAVVSFTGSATLDLQSFSETVSSLTVAAGQTATVLSANGSLTLSSGPNWVIGASVANTSTILDMSGLGSFIFDSSTADIHLGSQGNLVNNSVTVFLAAGSNQVTAKSFGIATLTAGATGGQNIGTVYLGQTNEINASNLIIGGLKSLTRLEFADGITGGSLKIRATDGTARATWLIGRGQSSPVGTDATVDLSSGSIDALIGTLTIGQNDNNGTQGSNTTGSLTVSAGTLDATSIILGTLTSTSTSATYRADGTLTLNGPGSIKAGTLTLSQRTSTGAGFANGTFNLLGGTLQAATIQRGTAPKGDAIFNWEAGTLENYDSTTGLTITGLDLRLSGSGARTFSVTPGRTTTVNSAIVDGSSPGPLAFTKTGTGTLLLNSASTYTGQTTIQEGILLAANSSGSATGAGSILIQANGTLAGSGRLAPQGTASLLNEGTLKAGTPGSLTASSLTLALDATTGGLTSTGSLSFSLFTNAGDNSAISTAADRLLITGAEATDISLSSILHLSLGQGSTLVSEDFSEGDRWLLVDWSSIVTGLPGVNFTAIQTEGITLPTDLKWTYEFNQTGLYAVVTIIPEPGRMALLGLGLGLVFLRRKRQH
ncbi:autotransporter-associated beta strand repeat-containing protein [Prosthecobacter sp. SYSU 5D2]|uniref:beta strand repeat-containing protein n=1 Tax=Prosthecobacter sp. SYSU 5D2 TaxID=3134134 RepID=UPI0031FF28BF